MTVTVPITEESIIVSRRKLGGLLPFHLIEIESFHQGVIIKNGEPISVLHPGSFRFFFRSTPFARHELWVVNTRLGYITVGEGKVSITQDGWQVKAMLTVQLQVIDAQKMIQQKMPLSLLREKLFSILQTQFWLYEYYRLGVARAEIEAAILAEGNLFAHTLGFNLQMVTCSWEPGVRDPRGVIAEALVRRAGTPQFVPPNLLPPVGSQCVHCGTFNRFGAQYCSQCGGQLI